MVMNWQKYYELNKHIGNINEIAAQYNMYVYQNEEHYNIEEIRKMGNGDLFILTETADVMIMEGLNEYGLLQEY